MKNTLERRSYTFDVRATEGENNMYILYRHIFPNDKVYIGITKQKPEKRWGCNGRGYIGCPAMYNAIKKYGWENVKHQILFSELTKKEAEKKEKDLEVC